METRSSSNFLDLDCLPSIPYSRSPYMSSGNLDSSEQTPRPHDFFNPSPDANHQHFAYTRDMPSVTRERPASFYLHLASGSQQSNVQNLPCMTRRFSDCLDVPSHPIRHHQLDPSRTINSDLAYSDSRRSPMNHRRSWRYGTDCGLSRRTGDLAADDRDDNDSSSPESLQSTRLGNYAASISEDGVSSLYEYTALDFPKPPPMASPVIRRMRSSPWFMDDGTGNYNLQGLSDQQWRMRAALDDSLNRALGNKAIPSPQNGLSSNSSLGNVSGFHRLDGPFMHRLPIDPRSTPDNLDLAERNRSKRDLPTSISDNPRMKGGLAFEAPWSSMHQSPTTPLHPPRFQLHTNALSNTPLDVQPEEHQNVGTRPMGRLPRIIRKVASMRSDAVQKLEAPAAQQIYGNVNGRKSIPKARSFRSILQSAEVDRARERVNAGGEWHRPSSWVLGNSSQVTNGAGPASSVSHSRLSGDRDQDTPRRQHLSVPLSNTRQTARERRISGSGVVLGAPFLHRPFGNQSSKKGHTSIQAQSEVPNSFINITPDRANRDSKSGGKRERVMDFLARASIGMFGWGKQRTNRNSSSARQ